MYTNLILGFFLSSSQLMRPWYFDTSMPSKSVVSVLVVFLTLGFSAAGLVVVSAAGFVLSCFSAGFALSCFLAGAVSCFLAGVASCFLADAVSCFLADAASCLTSCLELLLSFTRSRVGLVMSVVADWACISMQGMKASTATINRLMYLIYILRVTIKSIAI